MKDLEGRVAVVAGATRGAGRSTTNFFQETAFQWWRCVRSRFGSEAIPIPYAPEACVDDVVED